MNGENLLLAIGNIKEQHITEFSQVKPYTKRVHYRWTKYVSIAASLVIVISMALFFGTLQHKDPTRNINMMTVNGRMYEIIDNKKQIGSFLETNAGILNEHGLGYPVDENSIGNKLGVFSADDGSTYNVFDYKQYKGQSVLVVRSEDEYQFALFCNLADNNTILINDLLELYGFDSSARIKNIDVGGRKISNKDVDVFYEELYQSTVIGSYVDTDYVESIKITIKGDDSDVLTFDYYPEKKLIKCALTFYQISDLLAYVLNQ